MGTNMKICRIVLYGYVGCSDALGETTNYLSGFFKYIKSYGYCTDTHVVSKTLFRTSGIIHHRVIKIDRI